MTTEFKHVFVSRNASEFDLAIARIWENLFEEGFVGFGLATINPTFQKVTYDKGGKLDYAITYNFKVGRKTYDIVCFDGKTNKETKKRIKIVF